MGGDDYRLRRTDCEYGRKFRGPCRLLLTVPQLHRRVLCVFCVLYEHEHVGIYKVLHVWNNMATKLK